MEETALGFQVLLRRQRREPRTAHVPGTAEVGTVRAPGLPLGLGVEGQTGTESAATGRWRWWN